MGTRGTVGMLRTFWESEIIADHLYQSIAKRYQDADQKKGPAEAKLVGTELAKIDGGDSVAQQ